MNKVDLAMKAAEALIRILNVLLPDIEKEIESIRNKRKAEVATPTDSAYDSTT